MNKDRLRELLGVECTRLAKLGADGIASELASRGIQGFRCDDECCPLVRGLRDTLMIGGGIRVCNLGVTDRAGPHSELYVRFNEAMEPLTQFVNNFDDGKYPKLEQ